MSKTNISDQDEKSFQLVLDALRVRNNSIEHAHKSYLNELDHFEKVENQLTSQEKFIRRTKWVVVICLCTSFYLGLDFLYKFIQRCF